MLGRNKPTGMIDMFRSHLDQILNKGHELIVLSNEVDWDWIEDELKGFYSEEGRPSVPIRSMVGLLLLKQMYNESDESVIDRWIENPYWQYFTGEQYFQHEKPFDPSDFVHFRQRVGEQGMEKILALTIKLHMGAEVEKEVQIDTTVQEKNITFPTDQKLQCRIIEYVRIIAKNENIELRQSYVRIIKGLIRSTHNGHHPRNRKKAKKARKRIKVICGRMLRDVERKMSDEAKLSNAYYLHLYWKVLNQNRSDKNKIYSLHEPQVKCISKGKAHKKYEFGNKVAITRTSKSGVIVGVKSFIENIYDGHTLSPALDQCEQIRESIGGNRPEEAVVDRGCKGRKTIDGTSISIPGRPKDSATAYQKQKDRKKYRARAAIEPIIGHMKHDHRMIRNFLSGALGDAVNALMAGSAFNLKKRLNQIKKEVNSLFAFIFNLFVFKSPFWHYKYKL